MLEKLFRISKNWEFQNIYRKGRGASSQFFSINFIPNKYDFSRFGIVVSKKVAKKAVTRNKLKRQVRELVFELSKKVSGHYDVIISTKVAGLDLDYQKLKKELEEIFIKARLIK